MASLADFRSYLQKREQVLGDTEDRLCKLQTKFETFFSEVSTVRESELQQLSGHVAADRTGLPADFNKALDEAQAAVEKEFDAELAKVAAEARKRAGEADATREASRDAEQKIRQKNVALDRNEETLKARNEDLLARIADYNRRIRELSGGFGFFWNFFDMRKLQAERRGLDEEQATIAAQIEGVRNRWVNEEGGWTGTEAGLVKAWSDAKAKAAAAKAKLDYLTESRPRIVARSALERVLFARRPTLPVPTPQDPKCPRCQSANPQAAHFCQICAKRVAADRPDFAGSLLEIAEVNVHFERFSEGMQACQQIIGLVRGLRGGVKAFTKSVESVLDSQSRYPLPKLQIDVPAKSVAYGQSFDQFKAAVSVDLSLHPKAFADKVNEVVGKTFTEANIKTYFETMGEELSRCAKAQWG